MADHAVFISYRRAEFDAEQVQHLHDAIAQQFTVFYDRSSDDALAGKWSDRIDERLVNAAIVVIVVTENTLRDPRLRDPQDVFRREIRYAVDHGIALPVAYKCAPPSERDVSEVGLGGLMDFQGKRIDELTLNSPDLDGLRKLISGTLARVAVSSRLSARGDRSHGPSATESTVPMPPPLWSIEVRQPFGLVGSVDGPTALTLCDGVVSSWSAKGGVTSEVEVDGATSAALTSDGAHVVMAGPDRLWLSQVDGGRVLRPRPIPGADGGTVVGAWREGEVVVVAVRGGDGSRLLRAQARAARESLVTDSLWTSAVGIHPRGWFASSDRKPSGSDLLFDSLVAMGGDGGAQVDGAACRPMGGGQDVVVCRPAGGNGLLALARGERRQRLQVEHRVAPATGQAMVVRGETPFGDLVAIATADGVGVWQVDSLGRPTPGVGYL